MEAGARPVWGRKGVWLGACPKPFITAESEALIEEFFTRRKLGGMRLEELSGRQVDGFALLETLLAGETDDGQHNGRTAV
jgi:hypothetical protein